MATQPRRWPDNADEARLAARQCAEEAGSMLNQANDLLDKARELVKPNPDLAIRMIADAQRLQAEAKALQERIWRLMVEARIGRP